MESRDRGTESTSAKVTTEGHKITVEAASDPEIRIIVGTVGGGIAGLAIGATMGPIGAVAGAAIGALAAALASGATRQTEELHEEARKRELESGHGTHTSLSAGTDFHSLENSAEMGDGRHSVARTSLLPKRQDRRPASILAASGSDRQDHALNEDQDTMRQHPYEPKAPYASVDPPLDNPVDKGQLTH